VAATVTSRKYATRILKHGRFRQSGKKHGFHKVYQGEVVVALEQIREVCGRICSPVPAALVQAKRLHPFLPEVVRVLKLCSELHLSEQTKALLLQMSRSTIDRCLGPARFERSTPSVVREVVDVRS
jgi:hypothetical protein